MLPHRDDMGEADRRPPKVGGYSRIDEASEYYASIGPWLSETTVLEHCKISRTELAHWRHNGAVLGVEFSDGKYYYQAKQFADGRPLPGLNLVLDALTPAFVAPASRAGWLAAKAYQGEDMTRWDLLRTGEIELVVSFAQEDTARTVRP